MALRLGVQLEKGFTKGISRPENKAIKMEENQKGSLEFLKENKTIRIAEILKGSLAWVIKENK